MIKNKTRFKGATSQMEAAPFYLPIVIKCIYFLGMVFVALSFAVLICQITIDGSCQTEAAENGKDLTGGIGRSIAGEIADGFCDFFRQAHTAQGNMLHKQIPEIVRQVLFHSFCGGHSGKDCVAPDVVFRFLHRNQLCQIVDSRFAGTVGNLRNIRHLTMQRITKRSPSCITQSWRKCLGRMD